MERKSLFLAIKDSEVAMRKYSVLDHLKSLIFTVSCVKIHAPFFALKIGLSPAKFNK